MNMTKIKQKQLLQKTKKLGLEISQILLGVQKKNAWDMVRGLLKRKINGLEYQKKIRKEWI